MSDWNFEHYKDVVFNVDYQKRMQTDELIQYIASNSGATMKTLFEPFRMYHDFEAQVNFILLTT